MNQCTVKIQLKEFSIIYRLRFAFFFQCSIEIQLVAIAVFNGHLYETFQWHCAGHFVRHGQYKENEDETKK